MIGLHDSIEGPGANDLVRLRAQRHGKDLIVEFLILQPAPNDLRRHGRCCPGVHYILLRDKGCASTRTGFCRLLFRRVYGQLILTGQQNCTALGAIPYRKRHTIIALARDTPVPAQVLHPFMIRAFICSGCQVICSPASSNACLKSSTRINHWRVTIYSTGVSQRSCTRTDCLTGWRASTSPCFSRTSTIARRASLIVKPANWPAASVILPSRPITIFNGRLYLYHHSTSVTSPNVQHITAPVPFSGSAFASSSIGTC